MLETKQSKNGNGKMARERLNPDAYLARLAREQERQAILVSFENLLDYTINDHEQDHKAGLVDYDKTECSTCLWLAEAGKNFTTLAKLLNQ